MTQKIKMEVIFMKLYDVGNALFYYRALYKLSQNQLCDGICSVATLCRIEAGEREADCLLYETLFSRLGKNIQQFEFVLNEAEYRLCELRFQIEKCMEEGNFTDGKIYLSQYLNLMPDHQVVHCQFVMFYQAMLLKFSDHCAEEVQALLRQAIHLTRPDFAAPSTQLQLFGSIERRILYELFFYEKYDLNALQSLFHFMELHGGREEKVWNVISFFHRLVFWFEKEQRFLEMVEIAKRAIEILFESKSCLYLADFYFQKMKGEERIYPLDGCSQVRRKQVMEQCCHIFYLYMMEGNQRKMEQLEHFCRERLKCQIIKQEK